MAFAGMMIATIALIVLGLILVLSVVFQPKKIETPHGEVKLQKSWIREYEKCLDSHDLKKLDRLLTKHPDMIYYTDINAVNLIDLGLYNCDIEMMQLALDHEAVFDDPTRYDHTNFYTSLDSFYGELDYPSWEKDPSEVIKEGQTTQEMIEAITFAIDHGAALKWKSTHDYETDNFLVHVKRWAELDGEKSSLDRQLINLVRDRMAEETDDTD
ncbi:MAG: hypothetical protein K6E84_02185 [Lachnospiraceae bacterium]|nr:hypothetical protein [Lachnospiraceae bacterium]